MDLLSQSQEVRNAIITSTKTTDIFIFTSLCEQVWLELCSIFLQFLLHGTQIFANLETHGGLLTVRHLSLAYERIPQRQKDSQMTPFEGSTLLFSDRVGSALHY